MVIRFVLIVCALVALCNAVPIVVRKGQESIPLHVNRLESEHKQAVIQGVISGPRSEQAQAVIQEFRSEKAQGVING